MAAVKPEMRFREVGDIISQHAQQQGFVPASTSTYGAITEWSLDGRAYNYAMGCSSCTLRLLCKHLLPCKNTALCMQVLSCQVLLWTWNRGLVPLCP